jgi:hypothetical protein
MSDSSATLKQRENTLGRGKAAKSEFAITGRVNDLLFRLQRVDSQTLVQSLLLGSNHLGLHIYDVSQLDELSLKLLEWPPPSHRLSAMYGFILCAY